MTFKTITQNIINREVTKYIETHSNKYVFIDNKQITTNNDGDYISFEVVNVDVSQGIHYNQFNINGVINEYGYVTITSVSFKRVYCDDNFQNEHTKHFFIFGDDLKTFKFDK